MTFSPILIGVAKDEPEAVRLFQLAADQGLAESCYSLAMHLKFGLGEQIFIWSAQGQYKRGLLILDYLEISTFQKIIV